VIGTNQENTSLEQAALVGRFSIGELFETLVLYRNVDIVVDHDGDLRSLVHYLTPEGFIRLLREFGETVTVHVAQERLFGRYSREQKNIHLEEEWDDLAIWARMHHERGLPYWGASWRESIWASDSADWARRQLRPFHLPRQLLPALLSDERLIAERFAVYLRSTGKLSLSDTLSVALDGVTVTTSDAGQWFQMPAFECRLDQDTAESEFLDFLFDSVDAYSTMAAPGEAHLILPGHGAVIVSSDASRYARRVTLSSVTRGVAHVVLVADAPRIAEAIVEPNAVWRAPDLLEAILAARRHRLLLPADLSAEKIVADSLRSSWISKLPTRLARFSIFTSAGLGLDLALGSGFGLPTAVAVSGFDAFYLDRLLKRWRPNQYLVGFRAALLSATEMGAE
jgi:hypothetical protein